jgi:hypothetical protein
MSKIPTEGYEKRILDLDTIIACQPSIMLIPDLPDRKEALLKGSRWPRNCRIVLKPSQTPQAMPPIINFKIPKTA